MSYPRTFRAGDDTPRDLFKHRKGRLFKSYDDPHEILIYTDGACTNNGTTYAKGSCAFVFRCSDGIPQPWKPPAGTYVMHRTFFFRLENEGPWGQVRMPTSNRAELRAVVAALKYLATGTTDSELRLWSDDMDDAKLVIASDSTYVVEGAIKWCRIWETNDWQLSDGTNVKNRDLWELLLERFRELKATRCRNIRFWHMPERGEQGRGSCCKVCCDSGRERQIRGPCSWYSSNSGRVESTLRRSGFFQPRV